MLSVTMGPNLLEPIPNPVDFGTYVEATLLKYRPKLFEVTAYVPTGRPTATGTKAIPYHSAAVDPKVVPYGRWLFITGLGWYRAEDTGDSVVDRTGYPVIDICVTETAEAYRCGRRLRKVWIVSEGDLKTTIELLVENGYTAKQVYQYLFSPKFIEAQGNYLTPYHLVKLIVDLLPLRKENMDAKFKLKISHSQEMDIGMTPTELMATEAEIQEFLGMQNIDPAKWAEIFAKGGPLKIGNVSYEWEKE